MDSTKPCRQLTAIASGGVGRWLRTFGLGDRATETVVDRPRIRIL
jgi:hypothetical protein